MIVPEETMLTAPFWSAAREGVVMLQRCRLDGSTWHPPQPWCPTCLNEDWDWIPAGGEGEIYSFTVVRHAPHPAVVDALPYVIALVQLDEGPRLICNVLGCDPGQLAIGLRVSLSIGPTPAGPDLPQARLPEG